MITHFTLPAAFPVLLVAFAVWNGQSAAANDVPDRSGVKAAARDRIDFNRDIRPLLSETCFHCHGPDAQTRQADLRLDQAASAISVIVPGEPDSSELIQRIHSDDPDLRMPPPDSRKQLSDQQRELLSQWVASGADFQEHWAFIPPRQVEPPEWPVVTGEKAQSIGSS